MWPFKKQIEQRETGPFTDAVISALYAQVSGSANGDPSGLAALETCACLYARAFAAATIKGDERTKVITPDFMALVGRNLIRRGESVHMIEVEDDHIILLPCGSWDVRGYGPVETGWQYRVDLFGPSGNYTKFINGSGVIHCRYAIDPARSWYGIGPLGWSRTTATLIANLELRLAQEASAPVGNLLSVPQHDGDNSDDDPLAMLKKDLGRLAGGTAFVETVSNAWGEGRAAAPQRDWKQERLGADPPIALDALAERTVRKPYTALVACRYPWQQMPTAPAKERPTGDLSCYRSNRY